MKHLLVLLVSISGWAVDDMHYFDLDIIHQDEAIEVKVKSQKLFPYKYLRDSNYQLKESDYDLGFDGPFRQVVFLMRTLERNRGVLMDSKTPADLPILSFKFRLNLREPSGDILKSDEYKVLVSLSGKTNTCLVSCEEWGTRREFPINALTNEVDYQAFIEYLVLPSQARTYPKPSLDSFLVEVFYRWPDVEVDETDAKIFNLFPSLLLWDKGIANRIRRPVATVYAYKQNAQWETAGAVHAGILSDSVHAFTRVLETEKSGSSAEYIVALEDYVQKVPSDRRALKRLMDAYLEAGKDIEAYGLIKRFQPFFATIREGLGNQELLSAKAEEKRNFLLGRLANFKQDPTAKLMITSPVNEDLVTGTTNLEFSLVSSQADLLLIDAFLGDQRIGRLAGPPFKVPFSVEDLQENETTLRVVAYFQNETFLEDQIRVKVLNVDELERVNLVPIRASILSAKDNQGEVVKEAFKITENGAVMDIEHFRKSEAPLRIAFVLDTSGSMWGDNIISTQYAVKSFLEKLQPDDSASVYTFDDRVLKVSEFSGDFSGISHKLMSLVANGGTSLYDAMLIAHDALLGENGTKVLIVMSDGDDTTSATTDIHVVDTLRHSPVMVYSVILTGGELSNAVKAKQFLKEISRMTGSIHTQVRNPKNLPEIFSNIYEDLRSFYYLDYYSVIDNPDQRDIEVRFKGSGKLRYRVLR